MILIVTERDACRSRFSFVLSALLLLTSLFASANALAGIEAKEFSSESKRSVYFELIRELRCPKCQNQDIADSNAPIAKDMRDQAHLLVEEGKSHKQVVDYMIERFGEFVSYKPRVTTSTYLLWYGPWVLIGFGVLVMFLLSQRKSKQTRPIQSSEVEQEVVEAAVDSKNTGQRALKDSKIDELVNKYNE